MAKVIITGYLFKKIKKIFSLSEANKIVDLLETLEENPKKGKELGSIGNVIIKEIRYNKYRFYFITDGSKFKVMDKEYLTNLLIKFVRMSDKKSQQKTINEIKKILIELGPEGFDD